MALPAVRFRHCPNWTGTFHDPRVGRDMLLESLSSLRDDCLIRHVSANSLSQLTPDTYLHLLRATDPRPPSCSPLSHLAFLT
eukprot:4038763-Pyramimonas_sp.AAC.1